MSQHGNFNNKVTNISDINHLQLLIDKGRSVDGVYLLDNGQLVSVKSGAITGYNIAKYDSAGRVVGVIDANGNTQYLKTNEAKLARRRNNLYKVKDISYATSFEAAGGTVTKDAVNNTILFEVPNGVAARAYITFGPTGETVLQPNRIYAVSFTVVERTGSLAVDANSFYEQSYTCVNQETVVALKFSDLEPGKKYFTLYRPDVAGAVGYRLGIGPAAAVTGVDVTMLKVADICFEELTDSGFRYPPLYAVQPQQASSVIDLSTVTVTGNSMTGVVKTIPGNSIAIFGDSYSNDVGDYPDLLKNISNKLGVWIQWEISTGVTPSGKRLNEILLNFELKMQKLIDDGAQPKYVLIQSSLNTLNDANPVTRAPRISADYARLVECVDWALSSGIIPILTNIAPWKDSAAYWFTSGIYLDQLAWDDAVYKLAAEKSLPVFNLRETVNDPADPYGFLAANTSDGGIHPNATGYGLIATALYDFIQNL